MGLGRALFAPAQELLYRAVIGNFRWQPVGVAYTRLALEEKVVALTYDDGPLPPYTDQLLKTLGDLAVHATFFCVGERIVLHPETARRVLAAGHELGNHSYSHPRLYYCSRAFIRAQVEVTDRLLRELGVRGEIVFRAPYGESLLALPWFLWRSGRRHVLFDFFPDPPDWLGTPPERVAESVVAQARPGSIIVLHDGNPRAGVHVARATQLVVESLRARGYRFATVSELLALAA